MSDFVTVLGIAILATISYWGAAYLIARSVRKNKKARG